ncbi:hypothetical protein F4802DRAFT_617988 [Xylaria palmicola]|nr:hypothetical protein F4802DRAFT_617988 [Xylaria palmicola]
MDRKPTDPQSGGSKKKYLTAQDMEEAHQRVRAEYDAQIGEKISNALSSATVSTTEPPRPVPEHMQHHSQFVPSQPIPIPGAVPKTRIPVRRDDGLLVMTGSRAPRTAEELEQLRKADAKDQALAERYRRLRQSERKYHATGQGYTMASSSSSNELKGKDPNVPQGVAALSPHPPRDNVRYGPVFVENEPEEPSQLHQFVTKPFAHQYVNTCATLAYQERLKSDAEELGLQDNSDKPRQEKKN